MKILSLVMRIPEAVFLSEMAGRLADGGYRMEFVVGHEAAGDVLAGKGFKCYGIHERLKQLGEVESSPEDVQKEFGISNIRSVYMREMLNYRRFDEGMMLRKAMRYLEVMARILNEVEPDAVVQELGDFIAPLTLYYAARAANIDHVAIEPALLNGRVVFTLNNLYTDVPRDILDSSSSGDKLDFARRYLANYHAEKSVVIPHKDRKFFKGMGLFDILNITNIKKLARKLSHKYVVDKQEEYNAIGWYVLWHLQRVYRRKVLNRRYIGELPDEPYVYYPFHVPLDFQLTTRCPQFLDQLYIVDYIARTLPPGHLLLVKEHPASVGAYSSSRIKEILKLGNVRIVNPAVNSYDIINRARCVVTVNSKVGAEAIMQRRPVVTMGASFYRGKGLTVDVDEVNQLPGAIDEASGKGQLDKEKVVEFLSKVYRWSRPGEIFLDSPENVEEFSGSLMQFLEDKTGVKG
jgi:hypothetical protein